MPALLFFSVDVSKRLFRWNFPQNSALYWAETNDYGTGKKAYLLIGEGFRSRWDGGPVFAAHTIGEFQGSFSDMYHANPWAARWLIVKLAVSAWVGRFRRVVFRGKTLRIVEIGDTIVSRYQ